jgi:hypothetical protein
VRVAGGGGLAQQGGDDAPDARLLVAASGVGPLAVGVVRRRSALLALAGVLVLALAGAGLLGPRAPAALLLAVGAPVLAAAVLAGAGALAGAVGGLLAGPGAVDALAAGVIRLLEGTAAASRALCCWFMEPEVGFEPTTFRLRAGCSESDQMAPDGSSLLTWEASSVQTALDGSRRIVWMINRMIKAHPTQHRMPRRSAPGLSPLRRRSSPRQPASTRSCGTG